MKRPMKAGMTAISVILLLILLFPALCVNVRANEDPFPPDELDGKAVCLYDITHDKYLVLKGEDVILNTSTSAKVLMGLIACEQLSDRLDERIEITEAMISGVSGYSMRLKVGEQILIEDLLYGAICASYNDAAYVLSHVCSGSIEGFVSLMNDRAYALGATDTNYTNPIGFPDNSSMVTTLSDTIKIALAAAANPLYMEICSSIKYEMGATNLSDSRSFYNRNYLVSSRSNTSYFNPECSGMNAGISGESGGWSVITISHDDGADYLCIVLGGTESEDGSEIYAYQTVNSLVNWAHKAYNNYLLFEEGQTVGVTDIALTGLGSTSAPYVAKEDFYVYIPDHSNPDVTYNVKLNHGKITAPVQAGTDVGVVQVYCNGQLVGECAVVLKEDYSANSIMLIIDNIGQYTKSRAFIATIICFAILLPAVLIIKSRKTRSRGGYMRKY